MDILIEFEKQITISLVENKKEIGNYSSVSLTAGNFTANPNNFNFLPNDLLHNEKLIEQYKDLINHVNKTKKVGIMNQFPPTIFFFVPKTRGEEEIGTILVDLFNAIQYLNVEELLMTHWMYISSSPPQNEFDSLINFIKTNGNNLNLKKLYIRIDKRYQDLFLDRLTILRID